MSATIMRRAGLLAPNTGADGLTIQKLSEVCEAGTRVLIKNRFTNRVFDATSAPAGSLQEGPYVRIYPITGDVLNRRDRIVARPIYKNMPGDVYSDSAGAPINLQSVTQTSDDFMYELDAQQGSFYLPFAASLSIVTGYSGDFVWEVFQFPDVGPLQEQIAYQTRVIRGGAVRTVRVPTGAFAFYVHTSGAFTGEVQSEDTAKAAFGGTSIFPFAGNAGECFERPLGNATKVQVTSATDALLVFKIRFP